MDVHPLHVCMDVRLPRAACAAASVSLDLMSALAALGPQGNLRLTAVAAPGQWLPEGVDACLTTVPAAGSLASAVFEHVTLPQWLAEHGVQVFHGPLGIIPLPPQRCARVLTVTDLGFAHQGEYLALTTRMSARIRCLAGVRAADLVVGHSRAMADDLRLLLPELAGRVRCVPPGVARVPRQRALTTEERTRLNLLGAVPGQYLCVWPEGGASDGLGMVLRAWGQADREDHTLVLLGQVDGRHHQVGAALAGLPEDAVVHGHGLSREISDLVLRHSRALVLPPVSGEVTSMALRALSMGVPVVAAPSSALREAAGRRVHWVTGASVAAWAEALSVSTRLQRARAAEARGWADAAAQMAETYREAAALRGAGRPA